MKQFLRLFAVVGVILLASLISAGSCDKAPDANKNTNNNSGGDGNGGDDIDIAPVEVTFPDATFAKRSDTSDIVLKASGFPTTAAGAATAGMDTVNGMPVGTRKVAFSLKFKGATGGLTIIDDAMAFTPDGALTTALPASAALAAADKDGIKVTTLTTAAGTTLAGMNIVSIFASQTVPADAAAAANSLDVPFAFSAAENTQPIFWCVTTIPGITAAATAASTLAGGQKADCYVASVGTAALGAAATAWLTATGNIKRAVTITVLSIKTDAKTIPSIGLMGANDAAKVAAFNDGINSTELQELMRAAGLSGVAASQYIIKVLSDTDWAAAPAATSGAPTNP